MSPAEFIAEIEQLLAVDQDEAAIAFAERARPGVAPELTLKQDTYIGRLLEGARMVADANGWHQRQRRAS